MSVSYVDMHGRTVATALAGEAPANLSAIYGNPNVYPEAGTLTNNLLTPESNIIKDNSIESVNTLLVLSATNYDFTYKLNPGILKAFDCNQQQICFDCKYDLEIVIRPEDCGPEQTITKKFSNLQLVPSGESCDSAMGFIGDGISTPSKEINFSATLAAGSWVVRKTLTINDSAFRSRRETALAAFLCSSEESIYDSVLNVLSEQTGCEVEDKVAAGCDSCQAHLGTFAQYRSTYLEEIGVDGSNTDYDALIHKQYSGDSASCAVACGALDVAFSTLGNMRARMLNDMIPYSGQYALDTVLDTSSAEARFNVMITRTGHSETPYFRHPATESGQYDYLTDEGTVDQTIEPGNDKHLLLDTLYKDGFASLFQYSWTQSLIIHHPEYSKLQFAESTLSSSYNWSDSVQNCDSYTKAHTLGYDLPLTHDPFFVNNYVPADYTNMQRYISINAGPASDTTHLSFWRLANSEIMCADVPDNFKMACAYGQSNTGINSTASSTQKDAIWEQFRSLYLSYRNEMVLKYINSRPNVITQSTMDSLITLDKKQLIFATAQDVAKQNGWGNWWSKVTNTSHDTTGLGAAVTHYMDSVAVTDNCESQRIFWKERLMQCEQLMSLLENKVSADTVQVNTIINSILDSMVMVCHNSTDVQHTSGASDVNPSYQGTPQNFEDIINHVFAQYGISTSADSNYFCNPYSVDYPKPYNGFQPPMATNYSNKIDTCGCNRFAALKSEAAQAGFDTLTLNGSNGMNKFLMDNYHDSLTLTLWNGLQKCNNEMLKDTCYSLVSGAGYPYEEEQQSMMETQAQVQPNVIQPPGGDCPSIILMDVEPLSEALLFSEGQTGKGAYDVGGMAITGNMTASYSTGTTYTSCWIEVKDDMGNFVSNKTVTCGNNKFATFTVDECEDYIFVLHATNSSCSKTSMPFLASSPCTTPPCPDAAVIDSVSYLNTDSANNVYIHFSAPAGATLRRVIVKDTLNQVVTTVSISDTATFAILSLPACAGYTFQVGSGSVKVCPTYSNIYILPPCKDTCIQIYSPIVLDEFVPIPSFLNCDYTKPCISCAVIDNLVSEFRQKFSGMNAPYTDSIITDKQAEQNQLLARFMNYRTGFSATVSDYLSAYRDCHGSNPPTGSALCMFSKPLNDPSGFFEADTTPCAGAQTQAAFIAQQLYQVRRDSLIANFDSLYKAKCLEAKYREEFYVQYQPKEYHYTLYYYDQAGNLVKTLPPAAVKPNYSQLFLDSVVAARNAGTDKMNYKNNETLATNYRYNSLNKVVVQKTPDAGKSTFWYDRLARLVVSQNAKQILPDKYSYTLYDPIGRIIEVGQAEQSTSMTQTISQDTTGLQNWIAAATKEEITGTVYDEAYTPLQTILDGNSALFQENLRNRVSYTYVKENESTQPWDAATFYSYDIAGNVDTLLQDFNAGMGSINCTGSQDPSGNRFKKMVYDYDLISGKVNQVAYQPGQRDAFYHRYVYDAENRITDVYTSKDKIFWEREANYDYYRHGPLARAVLGQNQVQGIDYAYTIQGWLKGVNSTAPSGFDIGKDGHTTGDLVARDAFGFALSYYQNSTQSDYLPIGSSSTVKPFAKADAAGSGFNSLYNGNISAMAVNLPAVGDPLLFTYGYDQLNRIINQNTYNGLDTATNIWNAHGIQDYRETVTYDPNGNILTYKRNGNSSRSNSSNSGMDDLLYSYKAGTNQLDMVSDAAPDAAAGEYDRYNDIKKGQATGNYQYDETGNLVSDASEGITAIEWNVYGKIKSITKASGNVAYTYDAAGNRISKTANGKTTYYVRDAGGNVMSIYEKEDTLKQKEIDLYGSSRLGVYNVDVDVQNCSPAPQEIFTFTRGKKLFELTNHLGNVLATVSDRKMQHSADGTTVAYYTADVTNAHHYYPFGMVMPKATGDSTLSSSGFDSGLDGWQPYNGSSTLVNDNGRLKVSASVVWGTVKKPLTLETGKQYRVRFTIDMGNCHSLGVPVYKSDISSYVGLQGIEPVTSSGTYQGTFTATSNSMLLLFEMHPTGNPPPDSTGYYWLDDVTVEEIKQGGEGTNGNDGGYRYGFIGKEKSNEIYGKGNAYNFGARIQDPRLGGRFFSTDIKMSKYPSFSPYVYSANSPLAFIDPDGEDWVVSTSTNKKTGVTTISITINAKIVNNSSKPIDMQKLIKNVKANIERLYSGSDASKKLSWNTTLNLEEYKVDKNHQSNLKRTDHFIEIQDDNKFQSNTAGYAHFGGLYIGLSASSFDEKGTIGAVPQINGNVKYNTSIIAHEIGHTGGLYHPWEVGENPTTVNGGTLITPGQIDADNSGVDLYFTFMGYSTITPAGVGQAGEVATKNPNPATVGQITDIKLNAEKGNLNGNDTVSSTGKVIEGRTQPKKEKE